MHNKNKHAGLVTKTFTKIKSYLTEFHQLHWLHHVSVETENLHTSDRKMDI